MQAVGLGAERFVCVCNGARDRYQVPLALAEAGLLDRFVTDFYAPAGVTARVLPRFMRARCQVGLPRRLTYSVLRVFVAQSVRRLLRLSGLSADVAAEVTVDAVLARAAGRMARRAGAGLYCYHSYVPERVPAGIPLIVFAYHPTADAEMATLAADAAVFAESATSLARERRMLAQVPRVDWSRADAVVCASSFTARSVIDAGACADRVRVIPYGSDSRSAKPSRRAAEAPVHFLFVGQGVARKGLHHLIRAWQASPRPDAHLTIVSYRMDAEIAALIRDPSISVLGYQPRHKLDALFAKADVFAMPSLFEGFGLVYHEALSHGCHVIGTANSGLPDLMLDRDAVTLVGVGDIPGLSRAIDDCTGQARQGGLDRASIAAASRRWTWADFRAAIAAHAADVLAQAADHAQPV